MTYERVLSYFQTQSKVAAILGLKQPAVAQWKGRKDGLIPELQARKLAEQYPELKFDAQVYKKH